LPVEGNNDDYLIHVLNYQKWHYTEAINYLLGVFKLNQSSFQHNEIVTLGGNAISETENSDLLIYLQSESERLHDIWTHGEHDETNAPSFFIEWAKLNRVDIPWLSYATENGLYESKPIKELETKERNNLYKLIAVLHDILTNYPLDALPNYPLDKNKKFVFETQEQLINLIEDKYSDYKGLSASQLEKTFPLAKKTLN
jgi:hypothetical protein